MDMGFQRCVSLGPRELDVSQTRVCDDSSHISGAMRLRVGIPLSYDTSLQNAGEGIQNTFLPNMYTFFFFNLRGGGEIEEERELPSAGSLSRSVQWDRGRARARV